MKKFHEQFICYQLLVTEDIFQAVSETCGLQNEDDVHHIDDLWLYPATLKTPGSNDKDFDLLAKVTRCIMMIPHSNANEERIFSMINKNKTPSRSSLQDDDMLSSLFIIKTHIEDSYGGISRNN